MPIKYTPLPSLERLNKLFSYDAASGRLIHIIGTVHAIPGSDVGYLNNIGYLQVAIERKIYSVHRICWKMIHGTDPAGEVDHVNGNRSKNSENNLRLATSAENNQNRQISTRNKTGIKGVFRVKWNKGQAWRVSVGHNRGKYYITHFHCFGQAVKHANEMRTKLHREFARAA